MKTVRELMIEAGIDRRIHKAPVFAPEGQYLGHGDTVPGVFALRPEGGRPIPGIAVGSRYTVLQNLELADLADAVYERFDNGAPPEIQVWGAERVTVRLPFSRFSVGLTGQDVTESRIRIDNRHGDGGVQVFLDELRLVCKNGMKRLIRVASRVIAHTLSVRERVEMVLEHAAQGSLVAQASARRAQALVDHPMSQADLQAFFLAVHERVYGPMPAKDERPAAYQNALARVAEWVANMEHPNQTLDGIQGTAWAALNAVTQWADHQAPSKNRAASADHGALADLKVVASEVIEEVVA